jgi:hypothetical protein
MLASRLAALCLLAMATLAGCDSADAHSETSTRGAESAAAVAPCGARGQAACPLQAWMKATLQAAMLSEDGARLARHLGELAEKGPAGYEGWGAIASTGAAAASSGDMATVRRSCQSCHDQHRARYKSEMRNVQLMRD